MDAEDGKSGLLQGKTHQLVVQFQKIIPKTRHIVNTPLTEEVKLQNICVNAYIICNSN